MHQPISQTDRPFQWASTADLVNELRNRFDLGVVILPLPFEKADPGQPDVTFLYWGRNSTLIGLTEVLNRYLLRDAGL